MSAGQRAFWLASLLALLGLVALGLAWELWLAPLRPGGSWMVLKVLPLLAALRGIVHSRAYTFKWMSMLSLAYFTEGAVRAWSDTGLSAQLAAAETALALVLFGAVIGFVRASQREPVKPGD